MKNSDLSGNTTAVADKMFWGTDAVKVYIFISLSALFFAFGMAKHCYGNTGAQTN
jgi:hypothetical protein